MVCQTCQTPLEPNARFCGVCGHRLAPAAPAAALAGPVGVASPAPIPSVRAPAAVPKAALVRVEPADPLLGQSLNNRFRRGVSRCAISHRPQSGA